MFHWLAHKLGLVSCPRCETLVDYALDGLPQDQQDGVRKHLDDCPPCREQVRDFYQVREGLALCAQQVEIPDHFNDKVLARLKQDPPPAPPAPPAVPKFRAWGSFWMAAGPVFALMSVLMTLVAAGALVTRKAATPDNPLAALSAAVMDDPHASKVTLVDAGSDASAALVLCKGMDHAVIQCRHLPSSALGQDYALWMQLGAQPPRRLARFVVDGPGAYCQLLSLGSAFEGAGPAQFMVKAEGARQVGPALLKGSVKF